MIYNCKTKLIKDEGFWYFRIIAIEDDDGNGEVSDYDYVYGLNNYFAECFNVDCDFLKNKIEQFNGVYMKDVVDAGGDMPELSDFYVFPKKKDALEFKKEVLDPLLMIKLLTKS
ncbi:MAG: hypothetical protein WCJ62_13650 [Flavobacterium sp.]